MKAVCLPAALRQSAPIVISAAIGAPANLVVVQARRPGVREAVMDEMTQEEALRLADALVSKALKKTEARCGVVAQFISACDRSGSRTSAWSEALRELHALHGYRTGLMRRQSLIQQALECAVGEYPANVPLGPPPKLTAVRTQQQAQIQARRQR
jgi:hypothetical protein